MKWPLGKKFDLWVDAAPSDILEPLTDREKRRDYIDPPEAHVSGNIVMVPPLLTNALSRQMWATLVPHENGTRVLGRYGHMLTILNLMFVPFLLLGIAHVVDLLASDVPNLNDMWGVGAMVVGILIYDRITRPFAKTRYEDFVGYLVRISRDGAIHPMEGRSVATAVQQKESD